MAEDLKNSPAYRCKAYLEQTAAWQIVKDLCGGTLNLRGKGESYLPREPKEKGPHYDTRRNRAIFFNAFERTLNALVGMVFRKEPKLSDDVPEIIRGREVKRTGSDEELGILRGLVNVVLGAKTTKGADVGFLSRITGVAQRYQEWKAKNPSQAIELARVEGHWENIDNAGTHGAVFCKEVFTDAMRDGHSVIYVDAPPFPVRADNQPANLQDLQQAKWRPYWVSYCADQVINWRTRVINGQTKLDLIVFRECSNEADGEFGETEVVRYRVLRPGSWQLFKEVQNESGGMGVVSDGNGPTGLSEIPVGIVYGRKKGILRSIPTLLDLALINIAHYQKYSDFSTYLHIASRPILWFRGRDKVKNTEPIGAYTMFDVTGDNGLVAFAETTGAALEGASNDIKDLEARMATLGLSVTAEKTARPATTATEITLDHVRSDSDLATAARSLKDCVELCLRFHAQYLDAKATSGGSIELGATMESLNLSAQDVQAYSAMVTSKQLSLETMWAILGRAGKLTEDFDAEKEKEAIKVGAKDMADKMLTAFESGNDPDELEEGE